MAHAKFTNYVFRKFNKTTFKALSNALELIQANNLPNLWPPIIQLSRDLWDGQPSSYDNVRTPDFIYAWIT